MAATTFKVGKVFIEGGCTLAGLISGTATVNHNVEDTNAIGESWRSGTVLGGEWEVSLEMHYDPTAATQSALVVDFIAGGNSCKLTSLSIYSLSASYSLSGSVIITNSTITKAVGSTDKLSVTIRGDGAPAYS